MLVSARSHRQSELLLDSMHPSWAMPLLTPAWARPRHPEKHRSRPSVPLCCLHGFLVQVRARLHSDSIWEVVGVASVGVSASRPHPNASLVIQVQRHFEAALRVFIMRPFDDFHQVLTAPSASNLVDLQHRLPWYEAICSHRWDLAMSQHHAEGLAASFSFICQWSPFWPIGSLMTIPPPIEHVSAVRAEPLVRGWR